MISIIVPVYNTVHYLPRCIDSILAQTYSNFEAIFVDDGSKDGSGEILDNYEKKDIRIKVYHQENQGVTKTRAFGVSQAKGEWITFVDSDDTLPEDALFYYSQHFDDNTDIIIGWLNDCCYREDFLEIEEYRRRNIGRFNIVVGPHTHTYRRSILSEDIFNIPRDITFGEDMLMNIRIAFRTEKPVSITRHYVYNYDVSENMGNATNTFRTTMEYEHRYHQLRLEAIPKEFHQRYMKEMISVRVYDLLRYIDSHPFDRKWTHSAFYIDLMKDIRNIGYQTNKANMLLLSSKNVLVQYVIIQYKKVRTWFM